jgi:excinuclease ABC subunit A
VIVVEHDDTFIHHADWLIDIGPGPGIHGGEVLFNGPLEAVNALPDEEILRSRTLSFLFGLERIPIPLQRRQGAGMLTIEKATANNLRGINVSFMLRALNVVTGVSGAGKSTLTNHILGSFLRNKLQNTNEPVGEHGSIRGWEGIGKVISIDQSPIGRTPRSNPATYTGLFDHIRDLFAKQPDAVSRGYDKSRFSFNTAGGRCESCEGAGYQQVGMHFMGNVEVPCEVCEGRRFDKKTLEIMFRGKNISEILELPVSEAAVFFKSEPRIIRYLETLESLGLGYLTLGQRSSTLSGGEAQRIKLATELARPVSEHTLYIMDEPTTGLHMADAGLLLDALGSLIGNGHTVILIEHHPAFIAAADHIIDLGPGSGKDGGKLLFSGTPEEMEGCEGSYTALALKEYRMLNIEQRGKRFFPAGNTGRLPEEASITPFKLQNSLFNIQYSLSLKGVSTHNLKHINVEIPHNKITVITGVSGSGKSSLAFDTIFAEGHNRFLESFSPYVRSRIGLKEQADFEEISGLSPSFAIDQTTTSHNPRSTVGTLTGLYDHYRLLFSRIGLVHTNTDGGQQQPAPLQVSSSLFSFNHRHGACPSCDGLGNQTICDPGKLVTHPEKSLFDGAMDGTKTGKFYGDPYGQYVATLRAAGDQHGFDFSIAWDELPGEAKLLALYGTGDQVYEVNWQFRRDERTGEHHFTGPWKGFANLVNEEYRRKHDDHRGERMLELMMTVPCDACHGSRLCGEAMSYTILDKNIAEVSLLSVSDALIFFHSLLQQLHEPGTWESATPLIAEILRKLEFLSALSLPYLTINRISSTLSGGESQRIRLAGQLGSGLTGITYVLDEPTIGLHPKDTGKLMKMIRLLREAGNTVIIVEHDRDVILAADHVIDIGPGAGKGGGEVLASGTPAEIMAHPHSVTGPYLSDKDWSLAAGEGGSSGSKRVARHLLPGLSITHAHANNLKGFDLEVPSGGIVAVVGVSGSGKSTLLFDVILASWQNKKATGCRSINGFDRFQRIVGVHQRTGFNSSVATPATFTGIFDHVRDIFASLPLARQSGFGKEVFSFLHKSGRCPQCEGTGQIRISMDFLSDVRMECEQCQGKRYRDEILSCLYRDRNIAGILEMTISEACLFFSDQPKLSGQLQMLERTGLGYLGMGQPLDTLSGGEAQRLVLAAELMKPGKGTTLYMFEEPSTGLHFRDIGYLLTLFYQLADEGNTLLVIEHDPMIIAQADHIIELGPEGGDQGGWLQNKKNFPGEGS